jgi:hypothetical protein
MCKSFSENIIIMKAGTHAGESLDRILVRKTREDNEAGFCLWGYGGSSCHPIRQVQIHAQRATSRVKCLFVRTLSNPCLSTSYSSEYSPDGVQWTPLPANHAVTSSRWAIAISNIERSGRVIDLARYVVAVGPSEGKSLAKYLRGRSDKACARRVNDDRARAESNLVTVGFFADLVTPYGVVLR